MDFSTYQLEQLFALLRSPLGLAALAAAAALFLLGLRFAIVQWAGVVSVLFVPLVTSYTLKAHHVLMTPFAQINAYGRPIVVFSFALLCFMALRAPNTWRWRIVSPAAVAFFAFQCCFDLVLMLHGETLRAGLSLVIHALTFLALAVGLGRWLQTEQQARALLWCVVAAGALFIVGTMAQLAVNRTPAMAGNRLQGISGNPNYAGLALALLIPASATLLALPGQRLSRRVVLGVVLGLGLLFLGWTASRTGALTAAVALAITFRSHVRRFGAVAVVGVVAVVAAATVYEEASTSAEGLLRTNNSRAGVWANMWQTFVDNPLMGLSRADELRTAGSENSYLLVASLTGVLGLVPLIVATLVAAAAGVGVWRRRHLLADHALLVNYAIGSMAALFVAANAEGFLAAVIGVGTTYAYLLFALLEFLRDTARQREAAAPTYAEPLVGRQFVDYHPA